jgi:hypothetical protein
VHCGITTLATDTSTAPARGKGRAEIGQYASLGVAGPSASHGETVTEVDAGSAWSSGDRPEFLGGDARGVTSYGVSLRTNLGGLVLSLDYVNPQQFDDRGWHWQFTIVPGFGGTRVSSTCGSRRTPSAPGR